MKKQRDELSWDVSGRLKALEQFTGALVAPPVGNTDTIQIDDVAPARVPAPRRSRVFLRSGGDHGAFADLTLTAPAPRARPWTD